MLPKALDVMPKVCDLAPEVCDLAPKVCDLAPKVRDLAPKAPDFAAKPPDFAAKLPDLAPKVRDVAPKVRDFAPELADFTPKVLHLVTKAAYFRPDVGHLADQAGMPGVKASDLFLDSRQSFLSHASPRGTSTIASSRASCTEASSVRDACTPRPTTSGGIKYQSREKSPAGREHQA
jgi:hypothetical protein